MTLMKYVAVGKFFNICWNVQLFNLFDDGKRRVDKALKKNGQSRPFQCIAIMVVNAPSINILLKSTQIPCVTNAYMLCTYIVIGVWTILALSVNVNFRYRRIFPWNTLPEHGSL